MPIQCNYPGNSPMADKPRIYWMAEGLDDLASFERELLPFLDPAPASYAYLTEEAAAKMEAPTLAEVKNKAASALRAKRKEVEYGGFELDGQRWDSAEKDELRLNSIGKIFESGVAEYPGWKIAEGVYVTLTPELLNQASFALMRHYGDAFAVEAAKAAELETLETVEEVEAWLEAELNRGW